MLEAYKYHHTGRMFSEKTLKEYKSDYTTEKPTIKRCSCGFRIRGENHEEGREHSQTKGKGKQKRRSR